MDKNNLEQRIEAWKGWIACVALLGMVAGLLCSRAALSISMFVFGVNALWNVHPKRWFRVRSWLLTLPWLALFAFSGLWSDNQSMLADHLQVKLPFLLLPLAFHFTPAFSGLQIRMLSMGSAALLLGGSAYSLSFLFREGLVEGYKYSQVIPTPVYNDHIAFSLAVAASVGWFIYLLPVVGARWCRIVLCFAVAALVGYLHILAAKTGLVALYILIAALLLRTMIRSPRTGVVMTLVVVAAIATAVVYVPTLRERIGYTMVTIRSLKMGERHGIYSDAGRILSYDLALRSISQHPAAGVGAGDVFDEMRRLYAKHYPQVAEEQQLWPHNQFLVMAMAAGIPCALLFGIWYIAELRGLRRDRDGFFLIVVWTMLLVPLMVDAFLEVQFGVAVFLVFLLLQRHSLQTAAGLTSGDNDQFHPRFPAKDRRISGRSAEPARL